MHTTTCSSSSFIFSSLLINITLLILLLLCASDNPPSSRQYHAPRYPSLLLSPSGIHTDSPPQKIMSSPAEKTTTTATKNAPANQAGLIPFWLTGRIGQYFGKWPAFQLAAWCELWASLPPPSFCRQLAAQTHSALSLIVLQAPPPHSFFSQRPGQVVANQPQHTVYLHKLWTHLRQGQFGALVGRANDEVHDQAFAEFYQSVSRYFPSLLFPSPSLPSPYPLLQLSPFPPSHLFTPPKKAMASPSMNPPAPSRDSSPRRTASSSTWAPGRATNWIGSTPPRLSTFMVSSPMSRSETGSWRG